MKYSKRRNAKLSVRLSRKRKRNPNVRTIRLYKSRNLERKTMKFIKKGGQGPDDKTPVEDSVTNMPDTNNSSSNDSFVHSEEPVVPDSQQVDGDTPPTLQTLVIIPYIKYVKKQPSEKPSASGAEMQSTSIVATLSEVLSKFGK